MSSQPVASRWEDTIYYLTPVEEHDGILFKREDKFAPLGYGGINGSKLRQLIWLFIKDRKLGVASGAVKGSPQHVMVAACAKYFGMECAQFVGGKGSKDSDSIEMARALGASIHYANPGYAATLNSLARQYARERNWLHIETNITVDDIIAELLEQFHKVGSWQAWNIPEQVETVILPAGSCNSAVSALYGIARFVPPNLKRIILLGIGSKGSKDPAYLFHRLKKVCQIDGYDAERLFSPAFMHDAESEPWKNSKAPYEVVHYNLNGTGYCTYEQLMPAKWADIDFHPRYEGKCWWYIQQRPKDFAQYLNNRTLFWIVGSAPKKEVMAQCLK